jgi:hypothetical protein
MENSNPATFRCKIKNLDTQLWVLMDGVIAGVQKDGNLESGVSITTNEEANGLHIHISENVKVSKPIQIVSAI